MYRWNRDLQLSSYLYFFTRMFKYIFRCTATKDSRFKLFKFVWSAENLCSRHSFIHVKHMVLRMCIGNGTVGFSLCQLSLTLNYIDLWHLFCACLSDECWLDEQLVLSCKKKIHFRKSILILQVWTFSQMMQCVSC